MSSVARSALFRTAPLLFRHQQPLKFRSILPCSSLNFYNVRSVASNVSHKPASQSVEHAVTNAQEEAKDTAVDVAKKIAGSAMGIDTGSVPASFSSITSSIASQVPQPVMVLGLAGALPYLGTSLTTVYLAREAGVAAAGGIPGVDSGVALAVLNSCLDIQVTYGAVLLSFLGALHWGFEFAGYGGQKGYARLLLGITPAFVAWPTLALSPMIALVTQWVGFTGLWWADMRATSAGWTPKWYSQYRFYLSILVGTCIIGTLAGTSFLGPVAGHSQTTHYLDLIRTDRARLHTESQGFTNGGVEAVSTGEMGDSYVKIRKVGGDDAAVQEDNENDDAQKDEEVEE